MLAEIPLPNLPGNIDNWQGSVFDDTDYWNFSQRVDINLSDTCKIFVALRPVQGRSLSAESHRRRLLPAVGQQPLRHEHRGATAVWIMSNKMTLNVRGSYYNMIDEFYNPSLAAGRPTVWRATGRRPWYCVALQQRLRLLPGARRHVRHRHGDDEPARPTGPRVVPASGRVDDVGAHELLPRPPQPEVGRRDAVVLRRGRALRADQPRLQLGDDRQQLRHAGRRRLRQPVGHASCWAPSTPDLGAPRAAAEARSARATPRTSRTTGRSTIG